MEKSNRTYLSNLLLLFFGIIMITSCLEMEDATGVMPAELQGKWELIRVEEKLKTVAPPTDSTDVWVSFAAEKTGNVKNKDFPFSFTGGALVNQYFGGYRISGSKLVIGGVGSTKRGGPEQYTKFDYYYWNELQQAVSYSIKDQTLIIYTSKDHRLIYRSLTVATAQ